MFSSLARYLAKSKIINADSKRKRDFIDWNSIDKIALLIDTSAPVNKSEIDKFTESTGKYCDVYFLELNSKVPSYSDWICFTKKDKTALNLPKSHIDSTLKNRKYQLVINVCQKFDLYAALLCSQLNAPYNCGIQNLFGETDLIIEKEKDKGVTLYLKEVVRYLQMIRTK